MQAQNEISKYRGTSPADFSVLGRRAGETSHVPPTPRFSSPLQKVHRLRLLEYSTLDDVIILEGDTIAMLPDITPATSLAA